MVGFLPRPCTQATVFYLVAAVSPSSANDHHRATLRNEARISSASFFRRSLARSRLVQAEVRSRDARIASFMAPSAAARELIDSARRELRVDPGGGWPTHDA